MKLPHLAVASAILSHQLSGTSASVSNGLIAHSKYAALCLGCLLALAVLLTPVASGQVVRFETNAGNFDLLLNPTNNALLQGHVDNFLQYVTSGRYNSTVINRADEDFVLQMGGFTVLSSEVPDTVSGFTSIENFPPVAGVPAANVGLSNTVGQVGLALSGGPGGANQDSGTSSFYVNLGNNSFLDGDFAVFAQVPDMATINSIMSLSQIDLTTVPGFGAGPGNLAFTDVPLLPNGDLVVVSRAFVVPEPSWYVLVSVSLSSVIGYRGWRRGRAEYVL